MLLPSSNHQIIKSSNLIPGLCRLAVKAGEAIIEVYDTAFHIDYKEDNSPLTLADKRSNDVITEGLKALSSYPVLSEETKQAPYDERKNWNTLWLVDPLDGTKEFIKRNGEFNVNIALIEDSKPVIGIIYAPVSGQLYYAVKGKGAFLIPIAIGNNPDSHREQLATLNSLDELILKSKKLPYISKEQNEFVIVASRSHLSAKTEAFIESKKKEHPQVTTISAGSSMKFCLVAEGKADVYPRFAPTMEWDTAAGHIIATESGKNVLCYDTQEPLLYNKPNLLNPDFIVI